uniref:BTB domain-containing protein n=1 Tax=Panagrolaimus davidi TaxID=227884 RepID=A0A914QJP8_9BILA
MILAARSSVFLTMFKSEVKEDKIEITDFPYEVVKVGIMRCYGINEPYNLTMENNMLLLQFFEKYNMQMFKNELEIYLIGQISVLNVCDIVNTSLKAKSPKLKHYCAEYLLNCMRNSTPVPNYVSLDNDFAIQLLGKSLGARPNT